MQTRIQGTTMPVLDVQLDPNESVFSESGELSWMTASIQMTTHTQMGGGGGLFGILKRVAGGGSIFMTEYRAYQYPGEVSFATKVPGHIVPVQVGPGQEYLVHRHGFLCATPQVSISVGFQQSLGAGIFGGDGFLLQKIGGVGMAWLELSGELIVKNLAPGEMLRVHPGHVGAFQASVSFQITTVPGIKNMIFGGDGFLLQKIGGMGMAWLELSGELVVKNLAPGEMLRVHPGHVGAFQASVSFQITTVPGIKNMIFGGDGLFLAVLVGPGTVWLQTLPISRLAHQISEYLPRGENRQVAPAAGGALLGGIVGSILGGDQ